MKSFMRTFAWTLVVAGWVSAFLFLLRRAAFGTACPSCAPEYNWWWVGALALFLCLSVSALVELMGDGRSEAQRKPETMNGPEYCHADRDGKCRWPECPQVRDGEPEKSGRACPLWIEEED
jgi:hypothetical protein